MFATDGKAKKAVYHIMKLSFLVDEVAKWSITLSLSVMFYHLMITSKCNSWHI